MGEGEGGMIWENSIKTCILSSWNRSPVQAGCMRQVLGAGALGWPRGMGWGGRREGGSGWGTHVNPWLIHVNVWPKTLQYCKVVSLQLIKIIGKKGKKKNLSANAGGTGNASLICGSRRCPEEGNGNPLPYSCLDNSMDRGAWRVIVHGVAESQTWISD